MIGSNQFRRFLIVLAIALTPCIALGDGDGDAVDFGEAESEESLTGNDCFFDFFATAQRTFGTQRETQAWCQGIDRLFGLQNPSCFVRRGGRGQFHGRFSHRRRFTGNTFGGLFDQYRQFANRHLFRGFQFQHHFQFPRQCFGRRGFDSLD